VQLHSSAPPPDSTHRPLVPDVQLLSLWQLPGAFARQSPGGGVVAHWASFGRWLVGTRPASPPPDELLLELPLEDPLLEPLLDPLEDPLLDPLLEPELPLEPLDPPELPELDELEWSAPASPETPEVTPPQAQRTVTATTAPSLRCVIDPMLRGQSNSGAVLKRGHCPAIRARVVPWLATRSGIARSLVQPHQYETFRMTTSAAGARPAAPRSSVAASPGPRATFGTCERVYTR